MYQLSKRFSIVISGSYGVPHDPFKPISVIFIMLKSSQYFMLIGCSFLIYRKYLTVIFLLYRFEGITLKYRMIFLSNSYSCEIILIKLRSLKKQQKEMYVLWNRNMFDLHPKPF